MRILLASIGSRGDLQPFVSVGHLLHRRGHEVVVATDPMHRALVARAGLAWRRLGDLDAAGFSATMRAIMVKETIDERTTAAGHLLVSARRDRLAQDLAELLREARYERVICSETVLMLLAPYGHRPPATVVAYTILRCDPPEFPVPQADRAFAVSASLAPLRRDEAATWCQVGHVREPAVAAGAPTRELMDFLAAGPPPVFVTVGSMGGFAAQELSAALVAALRATGRRAIVQRGWSDLDRAARGADLLLVDEVPYSWLFPRVAAVVLHGGAGTVAAAASAARPMVLLPQVADQEAWAKRLVELGVSPGYCLPGHYGKAVLGGLIESAAAGSHAAAALRLAGAISAEEDGALALARRVESPRRLVA